MKTKKIVKLPLTRAKPAPRRPEKHLFRLFVAGATERSRQAIHRARELCAIELGDHCQLEVIDIYQQPELARKNQIVATPTLIKKLPRPERRYIGNLNGMTGGLVEPPPVEKYKAAI